MICSNRKAYYVIIYIKRIIGENTYLYIQFMSKHTFMYMLVLYMQRISSKDT